MASYQITSELQTVPAQPRPLALCRRRAFMIKPRADAAGHLRYALPKDLGGQEASNLAMAIVREHLAAKGLGLHNDLQSESSIVGNFPSVHMMRKFGTPEQQSEFLPGLITGTHSLAFGLTESNHGSDATWLETTGVRDGGDWIINGQKRFNSGLHNANYDMVFARTGWPSTQPTAPSRYTAVSATPGACRSSTSTVITAAIGSPKAPTKSRSGGSPASCSAGARSRREWSN